jgi:hypothetical protein
MEYYDSVTEDSENPVESEIETGENDSLDVEVTDNNTDCFIFFTMFLSTKFY